ncbi:MAG: DUF4363 family protein [Clostridium sp.]|nr:DUF4363 family protein [Clostridium sp.]
MKNTYISIFFFVALIIGLLFLNNKFINVCNDIVTECDIIEDFLNEYNEEEAYEYSLALVELIIDESLIPAIYLNHVDYDSLKNDALKLSLYIRGGDRAESLATLHSLRSTTEHLRDLQITNLENFL